MRRYLVSIICFGLITFGMWFFRVPIYDWWQNASKQELPEAVEVGNDKLQMINDKNNNENPKQIQNSNVQKSIETPVEINIAVTFTTQSPHSKWTAQDEESCEEAAILMAHHWLENTKIKNSDQAARELQEIVDFENKTLGFYKDTTAKETRQVMLDLWDILPEKVSLVKEVTTERIKSELAAGNLILVPTYGRGLGNSNYKAPGPIYHFLLIKGYTEKYFITNDPGTRKGADYIYTYDVLIKAVHDWNGGEVEKGEKVMLVVKK